MKSSAGSMIPGMCFTVIIPASFLDVNVSGATGWFVRVDYFNGGLIVFSGSISFDKKNDCHPT